MLGIAKLAKGDKNGSKGAMMITDKTHDTHGSISLDIKRKDNDMFIKSIKQAKTRSEIPQAAIIDEKQKMNEYEKYKM